MDDTANKVKTLSANSLLEYIKEILKLQPLESKSNFTQQSLLYRGLTDEDYDLTAYISRIINKHWIGSSKLIYERSLIESAISRYPDSFNDYDCPLDLLAKLQHYHIPTRLLDVICNALVALYFACSDLNDKEDSRKANTRWTGGYFLEFLLVSI